MPAHSGIIAALGLAIAAAVQISVVDSEITLWLVLAASGALVLSLLQLLGVRLPGRFSTWFASEAEDGEEVTDEVPAGCCFDAEHEQRPRDDRWDDGDRTGR